MTSQEGNESLIVDLTQLEPSTTDRHQSQVFGFHIMLAIIISMLSFNGDWIEWGIGFGFFTPVLLSVSALFYGAHRGNNWYRDEFLPYVSRILMQPEFENDRFLSFNRAHRFSFLIAGYLATIVCQFSWTLTASLLSPLIATMSALGDLLFLVFILIFVLYMVAWLFFTNVSDRILDVVYSDISHLIEIDRRTHHTKTEDEEQPEE